MSFINESIIYNIYPLGFCGAPIMNDNKQEYRLDKIYEWIDHYKELRVNAIVFNPVFESTKHGYDTRDYYKIDKRLGDNQSFKRICDTLHSNGIKVILDGVFNHVGREFWAFKDVQEKGSSSPYCGWFQNLNFGGSSPYGDPFWYEGWAGHYDLVKLNHHNRDVVNHLLGAVSFWIDEFDIDGLRLDVADCIDVNFFKELRALCKSKKSDFWLYGEIIHGDYTRYANPEALDSVTNYECYKGIYSSHNDHNYFEIAHSLQRQFGGSYGGGIYRNIYTYNFVDNHDVNRIASTLRDKNHLANVYTLMYTMPGVPSIYYGSEYAIEGVRSNTSDEALRPCLDFHNLVNPNLELCSFLGRLGKARLGLKAVKYGTFENVNIKNEQLVYKRQYEDQTVYIALNLAAEDKNMDFKVDGDTYLVDVLNNYETFQANGWANINIPAYSARILVQGSADFRLPEDQCQNAEPQQEAPAAEESTEAPVVEEKAVEVEEVPVPQPVHLGKYRHFKGGEYEVVGIAKHSETKEEMVVYKNAMDGSLWVRPYAMFNEVIERDGKKMLRFAPTD